MKVQVCIGSSCHKRGSYEILTRLKELVAENGLEDKVTVGSAFSTIAPKVSASPSTTTSSPASARATSTSFSNRSSSHRHNNQASWNFPRRFFYSQARNPPQAML